jgi:hypothetical protein
VQGVGPSGRWPTSGREQRVQPISSRSQLARQPVSFLLHSSEDDFAVCGTTLRFLHKGLFLTPIGLEGRNMVTQTESICLERRRVIPESLPICTDLFEPRECFGSNCLVGPAEDQPGLVHLPTHLIECRECFGGMRWGLAQQLVERGARFGRPSIERWPGVDVA